MKEQIEAMLADGKISEAIVLFADLHRIPASELEGFISTVNLAALEKIERNHRKT